ncbi:hypothetical protein DL93DRAFT_2164511 [Clavulina sp. PMI_390]|nr:hypothetical protein DL93DRAFT_2164511 [Clavulina sp. PMI_390]
MDPKAPAFFAQAVATTTALGVASGSVLSLARRVPNAPLAMGANFCAAGILFFGSREFITSPILTRTAPWPQYVRRRFEYLDMAPEPSLPGDHLFELRTNRLIDSSLSGALTGAILHTIMRGRARVLSGALTGALICTSLQYCANELKLARIRFLTGSATPYESTTSPSADYPTSSPAAEAAREAIHDNRQTSDRAVFSPLDPNKPHSFSERLLDAMSYVVPMKKLTPEEYSAILEKRRLEAEADAKEKQQNDSSSTPST